MYPLFWYRDGPLFPRAMHEVPTQNTNLFTTSKQEGFKVLKLLVIAGVKCPPPRLFLTFFHIFGSSFWFWASMKAFRTLSKPTISPPPSLRSPSVRASERSRCSAQGTKGTPRSAPAQCAERGGRLRRAYADTGTCVEIQLLVLLPWKRSVAGLTPDRRKDDGHGRQRLLRRLRHSRSSGSYKARPVAAAPLAVTVAAKLGETKTIGTAVAAVTGEAKARPGNSNRR